MTIAERARARRAMTALRSEILTAAGEALLRAGEAFGSSSPYERAGALAEAYFSAMDLVDALQRAQDLSDSIAQAEREKAWANRGPQE